MEEAGPGVATINLSWPGQASTTRLRWTALVRRSPAKLATTEGRAPAGTIRARPEDQVPIQVDARGGRRTDVELDGTATAPSANLGGVVVQVEDVGGVELVRGRVVQLEVLAPLTSCSSSSG